MKILLPYTLCTLLLWCGCHWESSLAFVVDLTLPHHRLNNGARSSSSSLFYNEPFDSDFLDERTRRSELVRILQNTFQKNNNGEASSINRMMTLPPQHGVFQNMPLWRDDYVGPCCNDDSSQPSTSCKRLNLSFFSILFYLVLLDGTSWLSTRHECYRREFR